MRTLQQTIAVTTIFWLLMIGVTCTVDAQVYAESGTGSPSWELCGLTQIRGQVLCTGCTVDEVRKSQPEQHNLYLLQRGSQQIVRHVTAVENSASGRESLLGRWEAVTDSTHTIAIRSDDPLWRQLTATENVRKDVEITGLLQSTTTFRVSGVTVVR